MTQILGYFVYIPYLFYINLNSYFKNYRLFIVDVLSVFYNVFNLVPPSKQFIDDKNGEFTEGSSTYHMLESCFGNIEMSNISNFVDLGSGDGKALFYMSIVYGIHSRGYELNPKCIDLSNFIKSFTFSDDVRIECENFLNFKLEKKCVYLLSATCLKRDVLEKINAKLKYIDQDSYVISISYPLETKYFKIIFQKSLPMSWGFSTVYVHVKG